MMEYEFYLCTPEPIKNLKRMGFIFVTHGFEFDDHTQNISEIRDRAPASEKVIDCESVRISDNHYKINADGKLTFNFNDFCHISGFIVYNYDSKKPLCFVHVDEYMSDNSSLDIYASSPFIDISWER